MASSRRTVILFQPRSNRRAGVSAPPFGLILSAVHIHETYHVVLIDQAVEPHWELRLREALTSRPVCLGVTAMTGQQIVGALAVSRLAKERGCPVVWGGIHATLMPEQTLAHSSVDYVVQGEGEETFAELVRALHEGRSARTIRGVWSKQDGVPHFGGERPLIAPDALPEIPHYLVELPRYLRPGPFGVTLNMSSSRGCPRNCTFCYNSAFHGSRWRPFSPRQVLDEIRRARRICPEIEHISFLDDSFFPDLTRAREIAEGIAAMTPRLTWSAYGTHIRDLVRMDDEYLRFLKNSGLTDVVVGVEAVTEHLIDVLQKNYELDQLLESNCRLAVQGISPIYSFLSGIPGETDEDIRKAVEVLFKLKRENPAAVCGSIKPLTPYPGTGLYKYALSQGFRPPERLEAWGRFVWGNYVQIEIPWVSRKRRKWLNILYFYSVALSPEHPLIHSRLFTLTTRLMFPIVSWRMRHLWFRFPLLPRAMAMIERFFL